MRAKLIKRKDLKPYKSTIRVFFEANGHRTCRTGLFVSWDDESLTMINKHQEVVFKFEDLVGVSELN